MEQVPRLLVVEDDEDIRDSLSEILEDAGFQVTTASDGAAAFDVLRAAPLPALILLDWMMPTMNGQAFLEAQAQAARIADIPVIVLSAAPASHATTTGAVRVWLAKPVDLKKLMSTVGEVLGGGGS